MPNPPLQRMARFAAHRRSASTVEARNRGLRDQSALSKALGISPSFAELMAEAIRSSPAMEMLREVRATRDLIISSISTVERSWIADEFASTARLIQSAVPDVHRSVTTLLQARSDLMTAMSVVKPLPISELVGQITPLLRAPNPTIASLAKVIASEASAGERQATVAAQLLDHLDIAADTEDADGAVVLVGQISAWLIALAERLPKGWVSKEGMLQYAVTVILFLYGMTSDTESEERVLERVQEAEKAIVQAVEALDPGELSTPHYLMVTKRPLVLRSAPGAASREVGRMVAGELVASLAEADGWVRVQYFDHTEVEVREAWAYGRALRDVEEGELEL